MKLIRSCTAILVLAATVFSQCVYATEWSNVAINGQRLTVTQLQELQMQIGSAITPGSYLVDAQGCWMNLNTGQSGCLGSGGSVESYSSRYGSGERTSDGSWNHYSCIYTTTGWSNC